MCWDWARKIRTRNTATTSSAVVCSAPATGARPSCPLNDSGVAGVTVAAAAIAACDSATAAAAAAASVPAADISLLLPV